MTNHNFLMCLYTNFSLETANVLIHYDLRFFFSVCNTQQIDSSKDTKKSHVCGMGEKIIYIHWDDPDRDSAYVLCSHLTKPTILQFFYSSQKKSRSCFISVIQCTLLLAVAIHFAHSSECVCVFTFGFTIPVHVFISY